MPMSWPYQLLGFIAYLVGLIASWAGRPFAALGDWWPGAIARHGWLFDFGSSAFTLGNFTIVSDDMDRTSPQITLVSGSPQIGFLTALGVVAHETGHVLTLAAFGFLFNFVGWVHERLLDLFFNHSGGHAYLEFLCEGIRRMSGDPNQFPDANPWIAMWAPPLTLSGTAGGNARVTLNATIDTTAIGPNTSVTVGVGTPVDLVATGCVDDDDYPMGTISPGGTPSLGFRWRLTSRPGTSMASIPNPTSASTTFTADVSGPYKITFAVTDGAEGEGHVITVSA
jgi:hypothetical protein